MIITGIATSKLVHHSQGQSVLQILAIKVALHGQVESLLHLIVLIVDHDSVVSYLETFYAGIVHEPLHLRLRIDIEHDDLCLEPLILKKVDHASI